MNSRNAKKALSIALATIGIGWVFFILFDHVLGHGIQVFQPSNLLFLIGSFLMLTISMGSGAIRFCFLLQINGMSREHIPHALQLYSIGQLIRYLPGRVWSLLYQISASTETIRASNIVKSNIDSVIFSILLNSMAAISLMLLTGHLAPSIALPILIAGMTLTAALFLGGLQRFLLALKRMTPPKFMKVQRLLTAMGEFRMSVKQLSILITISSLGWALYAASWVMLSSSFSILANSEMLLICAFYTLSWLAGALVAVSPAGLGVREAAFLLSASAVGEPEVLSFVAVFARIWFTLAEVLLASFFALFFRFSVSSRLSVQQRKRRT